MPERTASGFEAFGGGESRVEVAPLERGAGVFHRGRDVGALDRILLRRRGGLGSPIVRGGRARALHVLQREESEPEQRERIRTEQPGHDCRDDERHEHGDP